MVLTSKDRLAKRITAIESTIDRYLKELDRADREQEVTVYRRGLEEVGAILTGVRTRPS